MKERPILFQGDMVRAILEGRKTQTRRIVKNDWYYCCLTGDCPHDRQSQCDDVMQNECPYGKPGDRLWVRETTEEDCAGSLSFARYSADQSYVQRASVCAHWWYSRKICPSIHMPRWASRITLEITDVRVERLQDISEQDAKSEGVQDVPILEEDQPTTCYIEGFAQLWESINGRESWDSNPWVWVIEFRKL